MIETNKEIYKQIDLVLELADEMASAAAAFNSQQGYDNFIRSRSTLRKTARNICTPVNV